MISNRLYVFRKRTSIQLTSVLRASVALSAPASPSSLIDPLQRLRPLFTDAPSLSAVARALQVLSRLARSPDFLRERNLSDSDIQTLIMRATSILVAKPVHDRAAEIESVLSMLPHAVALRISTASFYRAIDDACGCILSGSQPYAVMLSHTAATAARAAGATVRDGVALCDASALGAAVGVRRFARALTAATLAELRSHGGTADSGTPDSRARGAVADEQSDVDDDDDESSGGATRRAQFAPEAGNIINMRALRALAVAVYINPTDSHLAGVALSSSAEARAAHASAAAVQLRTAQQLASVSAEGGGGEGGGGPLALSSAFRTFSSEKKLSIVVPHTFLSVFSDTAAGVPTALTMRKADGAGAANRSDVGLPTVYSFPQRVVDLVQALFGSHAVTRRAAAGPAVVVMLAAAVAHPDTAWAQALLQVDLYRVSPSPLSSGGDPVAGASPRGSGKGESGDGILPSSLTRSRRVFSLSPAAWSSTPWALSGAREVASLFRAASRTRVRLSILVRVAATSARMGILSVSPHSRGVVAAAISEAAAADLRTRSERFSDAGGAVVPVEVGVRDALFECAQRAAAAAVVVSALFKLRLVDSVGGAAAAAWVLAVIRRNPLSLLLQTVNATRDEKFAQRRSVSGVYGSPTVSRPAHRHMASLFDVVDGSSYLNILYRELRVAVVIAAASSTSLRSTVTRAVEASLIPRSVVGGTTRGRGPVGYGGRGVDDVVQGPLDEADELEDNVIEAGFGAVVPSKPARGGEGSVSDEGRSLTGLNVRSGERRGQPDASAVGGGDCDCVGLVVGGMGWPPGVVVDWSVLNTRGRVFDRVPAGYKIPLSSVPSGSGHTQHGVSSSVVQQRGVQWFGDMTRGVAYEPVVAPAIINPFDCVVRASSLVAADSRSPLTLSPPAVSQASSSEDSRHVFNGAKVEFERTRASLMLDGLSVARRAALEAEGLTVVPLLPEEALS